MRKSNKVKQLGKKSSHRKSMIKTQLTMLFEEGKVETTSAKAKVLKARADKLMSRVKNWSKEELEKTRYIRKKLNNKDSEENIEKYLKDYDEKVRIVKIGYRKGDNAELSEVFLEDFDKLLKDK